MPAVHTQVDHATRRGLPIRRRLARLVGNERGSFIVEIAMIGPIFLLLLFVIAETALIFIVERAMDTSVTEAARLVRTGQARASAMSEDEFRAQICPRLGVIVDCAGSGFFVEVQSFSRFADIDVPAPPQPDLASDTANAFDYGKPGDIVIVRAYYEWKTNPIYKTLAINSLGDGRRLIGAFAAFRNEQFPASLARASAP